jgi:hypothetical protein
MKYQKKMYNFNKSNLLKRAEGRNEEREEILYAILTGLLFVAIVALSVKW